MHQKLFELCLKINAETKRAAFFNFSGHTNQVDIYLCAGKETQWGEGGYSTRLIEKTIYLDRIEDEELKAMAEVLEAFLTKEKKIADLKREIEELTT